ncbi:MAG: lysophospholipid acyltransferase family protein [Anaerovoracaceae bacterium]
MIIFKNIVPAVKFYNTLPALTEFRREIDSYAKDGNSQKEREAILKATTKWGLLVCKNLNMQITIIGKENLPSKGPVVYVGNHQGYADIFAYCYALDKIQFGFIAKKVLSQIPLFGRWIERIRSVMIQRDEPREALKAINEGIKLIEQGFSLTIYPEGTRSKGPEMGDFKGAALKLATKPGAPIIPISIDGSYNCFEKGGYFHGAEIKMMIHPAIETAGLTRTEEKALTQEVKAIIQKGLDELRQS